MPGDGRVHVGSRERALTQQQDHHVLLRARRKRSTVRATQNDPQQTTPAGFRWRVHMMPFHETCAHRRLPEKTRTDRHPVLFTDDVSGMKSLRLTCPQCETSVICEDAESPSPATVVTRVTVTGQKQNQRKKWLVWNKEETTVFWGGLSFCYLTSAHFNLQQSR